jgi:hypothetical protein
MAVTYSRYKFVTASLPKRFLNGRFASETATWIQKLFKISVGTSRNLYIWLGWAYLTKKVPRAATMPIVTAVVFFLSTQNMGS